MKTVTISKPANTIDINDCHENDGKIYVTLIDGHPHQLMYIAMEDGYRWIGIGHIVIENNKHLYKFKNAIGIVYANGYNLTQLDNINDLS